MQFFDVLALPEDYVQGKRITSTVALTNCSQLFEIAQAKTSCNGKVGCNILINPRGTEFFQACEGSINDVASGDEQFRTSVRMTDEGNCFIFTSKKMSGKNKRYYISSNTKDKNAAGLLSVCLSCHMII